MSEDSDERSRSLYGDHEGRWAMLELPIGVISPPRLTIGVPPGQLAELTRLGDPRDVLRAIANQYAGMGATRRVRDGMPVQAAIAAALGITQQRISSYLRDEMQPKFTNEQYRKLVLLSFDPAAVATAMFDRAAEAAR